MAIYLVGWVQSGFMIVWGVNDDEGYPWACGDADDDGDGSQLKNCP